MTRFGKRRYTDPVAALTYFSSNGAWTADSSVEARSPAPRVEMIWKQIHIAGLESLSMRLKRPKVTTVGTKAKMCSGLYRPVFDTQTPPRIAKGNIHANEGKQASPAAIGPFCLTLLLEMFQYCAYSNQTQRLLTLGNTLARNT